MYARTCLQRVLALAVAVALTLAPLGCTSSQRVETISAAPPPPEAEEVQITSIRTTAGEEIAFTRPAIIGSQGGIESLFGRQLTEYRGEEAEQLIRLDLADIESYEYSKLETKPNTLKTAGAILGGVLAIAAIVIGSSMSGFGDDLGAAIGCAWFGGSPC